MIRLWIIVTASLLSSCGVIGPPVAPESIGVALTVEQQKKQLEALDAQRRQDAAMEELTESDPALQGQDVNLPPLRPVGTR